MMIWRWSEATLRLALLGTGISSDQVFGTHRFHNFIIIISGGLQKWYRESHQYVSNVSRSNVNVQSIFRTQGRRTGYHQQRSWWQEDGLSMCSTSPTTSTSRPLLSTPLSFKVIIIIFYIGMNLDLFSHLKVIYARNSDIYDQVNWRWECIQIVPPNPRGDENEKYEMRNIASLRSTRARVIQTCIALGGEDKIL